MKKTGILHGELSKIIGEMGHKDTILIGDAGMPIPKDVKFIDLAIKRGVPGFLDVLEAIYSELEVEEYIIAGETEDFSPSIENSIKNILGDNVEANKVSHEELKNLSKKCKVCIRTGEFTPYANIILKSGVVF